MTGPTEINTIKINPFLRLAPLLKIIFAAVLIVCFFLPLSKCTHSGFGNSKQKPKVTIHIPAEEFAGKHKQDWVERLFMATAFFFPVLFIPLGFLLVRYWHQMILTIVELLAVVWSNFYIHTYIYFFASPLPAGYLAVVVVTSYGIMVMIDGIKYFRTSEYAYYQAKYKLPYWGP
jgi:hypothetical protein